VVKVWVGVGDAVKGEARFTTDERAKDRPRKGEKSSKKATEKRDFNHEWTRIDMKGNAVGNEPRERLLAGVAVGLALGAGALAEGAFAGGREVEGGAEAEVFGGDFEGEVVLRGAAPSANG
jgi:hypothetical protein